MTSLRDKLLNYELFLANLGRCITRWAFVEEELFEICVLTLKAPRERTSIVYFRTPSIDSRLALVDELFKALLSAKKPGEHSQPIEREWDKLAKEFRDLLPERNAMAHFPLKEIKKDDGKSKFSVRPHSNERLRGKPLKVDRLDAEDLPKHLKRLEALEQSLSQFRINLRSALS